MNKLYHLAVIIVVTAFFSLVSVDGFSQCDDASFKKYNLKALISESKSEENGDKEFSFIGFLPDEGINYPIYYEFKRESTSGDIIKSGTFLKPYIDGIPKNIIKIKLEKNNKIFFIGCDSSIPSKRIIRTLEIN